MSFEGVEIDIRMRQNVDEESRKAQKGVNALSEASQKMREEVKESIAIQKQVLKQLHTELSALEKDFKKVNVGSSNPKINEEKKRLSTAVRNLRHEINLEEKALKELEKEQQSYTSKSKNLETEIRNVRNEMAALKMQGRENTQEYKVLEERLGLLGTAYRELSVTQKALSTGGTQTAGILSGLNAVSGAFTATVGAMGLVNSKSEDMEKIQTRIQSMMAITIGLQEVSNALHRTSAFRITTVNKVKELWAIANMKVATTLGITNVQAQILMGTLTLGLSVAITAIIFAIDKYITRQQEAAERTKQFNDSVANSTSSIMAEYAKMQREWESLGANLKDKEKYITDNKKAFDKLGVSINGVTDADNLFIQNTEAFKNAILERAKATAYMEQATEDYKKVIPLYLEEEKAKDTLNIRKQLVIQEEIKQKESSIKKLIEKSVESSNKADNTLKGAGIDKKGPNKNIEKTKNKFKRASEQLQKLSVEIEAEHTMAVIGAMKKGKEQKLAEIDAEYEQKAQKIQEQRKKLIELEEFLGAKNPEKHKQLNEIEKNYDKERDAKKQAINDAYKKEVEKQWNDLLKKYGTYEQKKADIQQKYAKARKEFEAKNQDGKYDANLKEIDKAEAKELLELKKSAKGAKSMIADIFDDLSNKSIAEKQKILANAKALFEYLKAGKWTPDNAFGLTQGEFEMYRTPQNLQALGDNIKKADELIKKADVSLKALTNDVKALFSGKLNSQQFEETFSRVQNKIQSATQLLGLFSDTLRSIGELSGNQLFGDIADGIKDITDLASGTMQGAQAGMAFGPVGAAVGAGLGLVTGIIGKIASAEKRHREALSEIRQANINQQRTYNHLLFEQKMLMEDAESIFGVDALAKAVGYLKLYNQSYQELQDKLKKKEGNFSIKIFGQEFETGLKTFENALDKIKIKTGHEKTGLFGWGAGRDIYSSITSKHKDLIKANGELNVELAKSLLQSENFGKGGKEALQEIIQLYKESEEAQKQFDEYLKSTFGELGNSMMDSVVNALKTGENAFENFGRSVGKVMENLGKQMIYNAVMKPFFDKLNQQIKNAYSDENNQVYNTKRGALGVKYKVKDEKATLKNISNDVVRIIGSSVDEMKNVIEISKAGLEEFSKTTKEAGFETFSDNSQRQAVSKGITQASQDSIDDVLGRLYALTRFVNEIKSNEVLARIAMEQSVPIRLAMLEQLEQIVKNTSFNKHLEDIAENIEELKQHGIKLKTS